MSIDIKRRRILAISAIVIAAAAFAFIATSGIGDNLTYYWSPSELADAGQKAVGATIRLGGLVEPGSIVRGDDGLTLDFAVTDGTHSVPVHARAVPPAMFRENIGVVLEGSFHSEGYFETTRLMVKHDNEYRAPEEGDERSMEELIQTMQFAPTDT